MMMKLKRKSVLMLLCFFLIGSIFIIAIKYRGYKISQAMLSRYIVSHSIVRLIVNQIPVNKRDINTKLEYINDYIHLNVHSYGMVRDDRPSLMLIYGEAWCDSLANIFRRLIEPVNIRGYLVFLMLKNWISPHSVAYCPLKTCRLRMLNTYRRMLLWSILKMGLSIATRIMNLPLLPNFVMGRHISQNIYQVTENFIVKTHK